MNYTKKLYAVLAAICCLATLSCPAFAADKSKKEFNDGEIKYSSYSASPEYKAELESVRAGLLKNYDEKEHMIKSYVNSWNYHTDKIGETYHHVRASLEFILVSLETGNDAYLPEIEAALRAVIDTQQRDPSKRAFGVWPYYKEEPVVSKKSPVDGNWAHFPSVVLLDIYMGHKERLSPAVVEEIKEALLRASRYIIRRNVSMGYTNIAVMGTYVTYATARLFNDAELKDYSSKRLKRFYDYTKKNNGFNEFNSPTYTITALCELSRLHKHVVNKDDLKMVEELEDMEWDMVARHWHAPTQQWSGPQSRAYYSLLKNPVKGKAVGATRIEPYDYIQHASKGAVDFGRKIPWKIRNLDMNMPEKYFPYFNSPTFPRAEIDKFASSSPVVGTCYMTKDFSLATSNFSTMWNQARPLLMYFKNENGEGAYLQPRFLHDDFDFSSVFFSGAQENGRALCALTYITNGGDKHIHIDKTKGKILAKDLRLRFELGNTKADIILPDGNSQFAKIRLSNETVEIGIESFGEMKGKWEQGGSKDKKWLDYVIYKGDQKEFDFTKMESGAIVFTLEVNPTSQSEIQIAKKDGGKIEAAWNNLNVKFSLKPNKRETQEEHFKNLLSDFPKGATPQEVGMRIAEKFLKSPHSKYGDTSKPAKQITYPDVCTWIGSLWFAKTMQDKALLEKLEARFKPILNEDKHLQPKPNHVDNNVFGALAFELFIQTKNPEYKKLGLMYADTQWELPSKFKAEQKAWSDKGYSWQTRLWLDDMFMINAVQSQAYRVTGEKKYIDRAAREMLMYLKEIQCPNGLFYHSPETPFHWGRGNGWLAAGMAEVLRALPRDNPDRKDIMIAYQKMMKTLLKYQSENGMWRQLIDDKDSWEETSATAMFTYAMIVGVKEGWLNYEIYAPAARKAWLAMVKHIDADNNVREVCEGTNIKNSREHYLTRRRIVGDLHGQAPYIWCADALLR